MSLLTLNRLYIVLVLVNIVVLFFFVIFVILLFFSFCLKKLMPAVSVNTNVPKMFKVNNKDKRTMRIGVVLMSFVLILNVSYKKYPCFR